MSGYESDSSGLSDQEEYTETNVLLGYAAKEQTDDTISHLGGHPSWLDSSSKPPAPLAKCKTCQSNMSLLLQLNGDLPEYFPNDERRLYIFTCRKKTCTRKVGSIRALREVRKTKADESSRVERSAAQEKAAPPASKPAPAQDLGAALFGATAKSPSASGNINPFSMGSGGSGSAPVNPFASLPPTSSLAAIPPQTPVDEPTPSEAKLPETFASKLKVSLPAAEEEDTTKSEPWPSESEFPAPFPQYYLDADYEALAPLDAPEQATEIVASSSNKYEDETPSGSGGEKDNFESDLDKAFLRFSDRLAQNPEQVLRYEWKGTPLLYSTNDSVASRFPSLASRSKPPSKVSTATSSSGNNIPRCEKCGASRVFELQLVPGLISALEDDDSTTDIQDLDAGMEWGTIILGVCEKNCAPQKVGQVGWREEWCGVQWEERIARK